MQEMLLCSPNGALIKRSSPPHRPAPGSQASLIRTQTRPYLIVRPSHAQEGPRMRPLGERGGTNWSTQGTEVGSRAAEFRSLRLRPSVSPSRPLHSLAPLRTNARTNRFACEFVVGAVRFSPPPRGCNTRLRARFAFALSSPDPCHLCTSSLWALVSHPRTTVRTLSLSHTHTTTDSGGDGETERSQLCQRSAPLLRRRESHPSASLKTDVRAAVSE